jgi:outer membrane protein assembly factor BamB
MLGQDWPQHLGPGRNGVYTGAWSAKSTFAKVWERPVGEGFSAPVVVGTRLILFHREGNQEVVESLDAGTGKTQWRTGFATAYRDDFGFSNGPRATPAVDANSIYVYGADGNLHGVRLDTGARQFSIDAKREFGVRKEFFGAAVSPLIDGNLILMNIGGANGAGIVAIHKATGKPVWKALDSEAGYASPAAATIGGVRMALFFTREGLTAAEAASGRILFQHRFRSRQQASVNAATPLVHENRIFLTASYDTGAALLAVDHGKSRVVWSGDDSISSHYASPVLHNGYLYGFHGRQEFGQELRCVEWATGKVAWSVPNVGAGTVTLAGDHLFVLRENGELLVAPATPKSFQSIRKAQLATGTVRSYPAFSGGRMYLRNEERLLSYRID